MQTPDKKQLLEAYNKADKKGKQLLESLYGAETFAPDIQSRIKSFEDACGVLGIAVASVLSGHDTPDEAAYKKLKVICQALNEGWTPDWENDDEYKYYPYFDMSGGFSFGYVDYYYRNSCVGSRLCFRTRELATYAANQFTDLYKTFFTA